MPLAPLLHCAASLEMPVGVPGIPVVSFLTGLFAPGDIF